MTVLITGGTGKLGKEFVKLFPDACTPSRRELDLLDEESVRAYVKECAPDLVIHTAAYTSVSGAEENQELCWNTNVRGTEYLVESLLENGGNATLVYISTACVFRGDRGGYIEDDVPYPKNFYALTKLIGEKVAERMDSHLITRTNFIAREPWPYPKAFTDRFGTYLFAHDVAAAIKNLVDENIRGLVHVTGDRKMSMFELARITTPGVSPLTMRETHLPLTVDMTLKSVRIRPYHLTLSS